MSAPPIHARKDGGSCFSVGILHLQVPYAFSLE